MSKIDAATKVREAKSICGSLGLATTDTNVEQCATLVSALRIFDERNTVRGDGWREAGLEQITALAQSKIERMKRHMHNMQGPFYWIWDAAEDDALDLINYAAFLARLINEDRWQ